MESERILVVDDDEKICQILSIYLHSKGYEVITCKSGLKALSAFEDSKPDLVLLDVMLPGLDGWEVLEQIRRISSVPVIMLTAKGDITDKIQGLDCGADDYVVKPFDSKELIARIRAVLRRTPAVKEEENKPITVGDLTIDPSNYVVTVAGKEINMPPKEIELLYFLACREGKVLSRGQLLENVWGFDFYGDSRTVDVHIKRIRDRLGESKYWQIRTIWSVGYRFERLTDTE